MWIRYLQIITKNKIESFKNKTFHTSHIIKYILIGIGLLSVGVSPTRLPTFTPPISPICDLEGLWCVSLSAHWSTLLQQRKWIALIMYQLSKHQIRKLGLSSAQCERRLLPLIFRGHTQWGVEMSQAGLSEAWPPTRTKSREEESLSPWPQWKYSWPLSNMGLNCVGPPGLGFFSVSIYKDRCRTLYTRLVLKWIAYPYIGIRWCLI